VSSCERLNLEHTSHPDALRNGDRKEFPVYRQSVVAKSKIQRVGK
jgi:hypothetical protein